MRSAGLVRVEGKYMHKVFYADSNIASQWNQPSIDFYEKALGATAMSEWMGMRLEGEGISNLKRFSLQ